MKKQKEKDAKKKLPFNYGKYSGIAFQMIIIIIIGVFAGIKADELLELTIPVFTLIFTVLSIILSIYYTLKDL